MNQWCFQCKTKPEERERERHTHTPTCRERRRWSAIPQHLLCTPWWCTKAVHLCPLAVIRHSQYNIQKKKTLIDRDNSVTRTKNWNPLSVNLGGSLSSLFKKAWTHGDYVDYYKIIHTHADKELYICYVWVDIYPYYWSGRYLWLKSPRWKIFIIEELMFVVFPPSLELIRFSRKHWLRQLQVIKRVAKIIYRLQFDQNRKQSRLSHNILLHILNTPGKSMDKNY